jgi:hypothetical protein
MRNCELTDVKENNTLNNVFLKFEMLQFYLELFFLKKVSFYFKMCVQILLAALWSTGIYEP